ncbi:MAG: alpha/beta fold hydrolase [Candidatus Binataceae bacterium]
MAQDFAENFVLVHGSWHGAWCWTAVIGELERNGYRALAVDLPGHGINRCAPAHVTRDAYIESVVSFIEQHGLDNVVLAGHSLAGITIPGVAARIPKRIKRVVFVSALIIEDGVATAEELAPLMAAHAEATHGLAEGNPDLILTAERFRAAFIQDGTRDLQDFVYSALTPEPTAPLLEPVRMNRFYELDIPSSYLVCENDLVFDDPRVWHPGFSRHLKNATTRSIKSSHEVMFTKPVECARALIELARD